MNNTTNNVNALVVGANQGIGLGFLKKLLEDKGVSKIYASYRCQESSTELFSLANQHPEKISCLQMDLTQEEQIAQTAAQIQARAEKLHLVINSVGILHEGELQPEKNLRQVNPEHLLRYFQVNSIGSLLLAKHLLPLLRHSEKSVFAAISAKVGSIGDNQLGGWYGYRASKAALNMFLHTVAIEYRRTSPQTIVVLLHPGTTDTRLSQPFHQNVPPDKLFSVERTVSQLLAVIENLQPSDSGEFFSWDGSRLPW